MGILRLKVTLAEIQPPVWRRVEVPADLTLHGLHKVIQAAFGWSGTHLHEFNVQGVRLAPPDPDSADRVVDSRKQPLAAFEGKVQAFDYTYDFGDDWGHHIEIEAWTQAETGVSYPRCLDGTRACPPEDCGGPPGYEDLLSALGDPKHERHEELTEWLAEIYDGNRLGWKPEAFDLAETNAALKRLRLPKPQVGAGPWAKVTSKGPKPLVGHVERDEILEGMMAELKGVKMTPELEKIFKDMAKMRTGGGNNESR